MAQNFIFCSVLWIVVAVIAVGQSQVPTTRTPATSTPAPGTTAAPFTTVSPTPAPGTTVSPTPAPDPCDKNPCGRGSTCETRADQTFICLCLPGDYYNNINNRCDSAKVFPGQLELPQIVYENSMSDKASPAFKRAADIITEELDKSLKPVDPTYRGCIVLELRPVSNTRLRAMPGVNASVELIYSAESTVTTSQVLQMVKNATECTNCLLAGATFTEVDLCQRNPCDGTTTSCSSLDGTFSCTCLDGYVPFEYSSRTCVDPCDKNPCGRGSTCETRGQTFICLCLPGDYYNNINNRCESAKVFPGLLELPEIVYENSMSDKASPAFKRAADIITEELDKSLGSNPTYLGCIVLELRPVNNTRLRATQHVSASVELIYSAESTVTTSQVQAMVKNATECTDCSLKGATFAAVNLCERNPCDVATTRCSSLDGALSCTCLDGYVPSYLNTTTCLACPCGQRPENSVCVMCPFGYSGFNCKDTWQLTLVIVGSVLGGLLLILLTIVSVWCLKKSSKKNKASDIGLIPAKGPVANKRPDNRNSQREDNHYDEILPYAVYEPTPK